MSRLKRFLPYWLFSPSTAWRLGKDLTVVAEKLRGTSGDSVLWAREGREVRTSAVADVLVAVWHSGLRRARSDVVILVSF